MQASCNRAMGMHPLDFNASGMESQAHTSCNRRAGYYVRKTTPPLTPASRLLDRGTGAAIRGNPARGPAVLAKHAGHGSVSRERRRDGRYGQKWADSNGDSRQAEVAVKSSAGSRPLLERQESALPRREDDAPVFHSSNGSRMHNGCPANHSSRRINSAAGQAKRATLHLRHNDRVKKRYATSFNFVSFSSSPFSLLLQRPGKGILQKGSFSVKEAGPKPYY
jgi:hypothetical protein